MRLILLYLFLLYYYFCQAQAAWNYPLGKGSAGVDSFVHQQDSLVIYSGTDSFKVIDNAIDLFIRINDTIFVVFNNGTIDTIAPQKVLDTSYVNNDTLYLLYSDFSLDVNKLPIDSSCVIRDTRANLISLRNSGLLDIGCHYVATDVTYGTLGNIEVLLHATSVNSFSLQAEIKTSFDNSAWTGMYDIDLNQVLEIKDNRGNILKGTSITNVGSVNTVYLDNF